VFGWFRGRTEESEAGIRMAEKLRVDLHSHLLPGIDDGAKTMEESLTLVRKMAALGFEKLILTPHVMIDAYPNSRETILEKLLLLREAVSREEIPIQLEASAEYYLDEGFPGLLEREEILPIAGKYLLFETSYMAKPHALPELIYAIKIHGYIPLMAHPERYRYVRDLEREYGALREQEVLFQLDSNSLGGFYGKDARRKADFLLQRGWIDFLGSDTHRMRHLEQLESVLGDRRTAKTLWEKNRILNATLAG